MGIIQRNAVSDEQQGSNQQIENRFRSGGVVLQKLLVLINKLMGFSQSLLRVPVGGDTLQ
jgi:hypothetical protein